MNPGRLDSYSIEDLTWACAQQASRQGMTTPGFAPCYELFRRAFNVPPDESAWQAILGQYSRLISYWLGQHSSEDAIQEVFLRFWKAQQSVATPFATRFPNISAVVGYLKQCAISVRFEAWREEERWRLLRDRLHDAALVESVLGLTRRGRRHESFDCKQLVLSRLKDEREQVVFELMYRYNLAPREVQTERPDLFPDARAVYRVKENLLKRLRRDPELRSWWADSCHHADDGGNSTGSPVQ